MGSERVRSMVPALTFGTAKSKVELRVARRGKISLRGSGIFTPDELAQVVEQVQNWVQQLRQPAGVVLMVDSRLGFTDLDLQLLDFVAPRLANGAVKLLVLLTKADKLNRREADQALAACQDTLAARSTEESDIGITLFSALKRRGVDDAAVLLRSWVEGAPAA